MEQKLAHVKVHVTDLRAEFSQFLHDNLGEVIPVLKLSVCDSAVL